MKFLFLHGPPAAGKLTIAKAILEIIEGKLFDNHVSIDAARSLFEFGTPEFWDLVHEIRNISIEKAAIAKIPLMIFTTCYSHPEDLERLKKREAILEKYGSIQLPVYISCSAEKLRARIANADRKARNKLSSVDVLDKFMSETNLIAIPRDNCLTINSEILQPDEAANIIINHFKLHDFKKN